ncbi:MAG TPA: protein kinase [Thermoanaerobaculia bacterium]|nr:protein kinase [Thermoanaerobaculia bacterium]
MTLEPGTELGHYEILSPVAAGGMGDVYRARDVRLGREVAIKVLSSERTGSAADQRRFQQEARTVALLSHPNILAIHEFGTDRGVSFVVTELLNGETLAQRIRTARIPWSDAVRIAAAICDGLAAAHDKGIVHRDLKPANIFLTADGYVKILDFGLARMPAASDGSSTDLRTAPGTVMGTIGYMPPEQLRGEPVDASADIFALGCMLSEMIAGTSPFARRTATEINAAILRDEPVDLPAADAPPPLNRLIRRCLEKNRSDRYHSAHDLALELRSMLTASRSGGKWRVLIAAAAAIVLAIVVAVVIMQRRTAAPQHEIRSLLVIPFENGTRDANAEYLSDGIAEGLINTLAELPHVRVVARTTAFRFKGKPVDLPRIRQQLDVDAVLSGRLVSAAGNIVVQADLVDTAAGTELWGNRFHEQRANVLEIEEEIVGRIAAALRVRLAPSRRSTRNPEAYKLYLQGRFYWNKRNPEAITKARQLFEQAIAADPEFALAYTGLADACNMLGVTYHGLPAGEGMRCARQAVQTALRLNPDLAEAHASLGLIELNQFHWSAAESEFQRAFDLNPQYANALLWRSLGLLAEGRLDESIASIRKAEQLDPLSAIMVTNVGHRLTVAGNYKAALAEGEKATELDGGYVWGRWITAIAHEGLGDLPNAAAAFRQAAQVANLPGLREALLARASAVEGDRAGALRLALDLERRAAHGEVGDVFVGWSYCAAGNRDKAIEWLNRAFDARETLLRDHIRTPAVKELRGDPRYEELIHRLERGFDD